MTIASLWRHPIKAVGREAVSEAALSPGETFPGDRLWAILHEAGTAVDGEWSRCPNFIRAASSPALMAVEAKSVGDRIELRHPDRPTITVDPVADETTLIDWLTPLVGEGRAAPVKVVRSGARGMTDAQEPTISVGNLASLRDLSERAGTDLSEHRFRCNVWLDGLAPWEEFEWVGKSLRLGTSQVEVIERIGRCQSTAASPETGERDVRTLDVLDTFGHRDFTVGVVVKAPGTLKLGDTAVLA
ncbi:MOSC domain-containing protein [Pelagovum pacificum]|nr:MOSC N-terminal beta barrel domain-containing protein [Pelagovum pacificum]